MVEIDLLLGKITPKADAADVVPSPPPGPAITRLGDLWQIGPHLLICGDATDLETSARLLDGSRAQMVFTDPPYNVKIDGHVSGHGAIKHREFAFASGEMSPAQFTRNGQPARTQSRTRCAWRSRRRAPNSALLADLKPIETAFSKVKLRRKEDPKALPKMAKKASSPKLAAAFQAHIAETETQIEQLEQVFELIGKSARGKTCPANDEIIGEGKEIMKKAETDTDRDRSPARSRRFCVFVPPVHTKV